MAKKDKKTDTKNKGTLLALSYGYLFSTIGLILLAIGGAGIINLGLKTTIFTESYMDNYYMPPEPYWIEKTTNLQNCNLTEEQQLQLNAWLQDYEQWQEYSKNSNYKSMIHESAARNLALILVGLPLFIFSRRFIKAIGS